MVSATTPAAGTAVTSVRSLNETVDSLVSMSTVLSTGRLRVDSGFMAARRTMSPPVDMPPSIPPARVVSAEVGLRLRPSGWRRGPREPRWAAVSNPSPKPTPLTAWMLQMAWASRPSSRRSQWTWLPSPTGTP